MIQQQVVENQFGFQKGRKTRETILGLKKILERKIKVNKNTYATFIDLEKAFDKEDWKILFKTLREKDIDWRNKNIILNLYKK